MPATLVAYGRCIALVTMVAAVTLMLLPPASSRAGVVVRIYVDQTALGGDNDGTSWADAYRDLTTALATATNPAEVWVAAGTYTPGANRTDSFQMETGVALYGGFSGVETSLAQRNIAANPTILSGAIADGTVTNNAYHVVDASTVGATAVLDGFTITGGYADGVGNGHWLGGGIRMSSGSPVIRNTTIRGNVATHGGGVYVDDGSPLFDNVTFIGNTADRGGGLYTETGAPWYRTRHSLRMKETWGAASLVGSEALRSSSLRYSVGTPRRTGAGWRSTGNYGSMRVPSFAGATYVGAWS